MKKIIFLFLTVFFAQNIFAQSAHKHLRDGNKSYQEENYTDAAEAYHKALKEDPSNVKSKFNLGNATYKSKGFEEAIKNFSSAAHLAEDEKVKANAFYNLGNALFQKAQTDPEEQQKILEQSVEAYKNSLRLNPKDIDAKKNLSLTQRQIRRIKQQQQQQQQQQNQDQKGQKKENQDEQENQDPQDQKDQQQQKENEQKDQSQEQQDGQDQKNKNESGKDLSKEEALELLKIMDEEERKVQEKMRKAQSKGKKKPEKDW